MDENPIEIKSGELTLEGRLSRPSAAGSTSIRGAVVCHPHPLYGGSMDNNVVGAIVRALSSDGIATLRFNFRGVGRSGGVHGGGVEEMDDVRAAVARLASEENIDATVLAGYSFGARMALGTAPTISSIDTLIAVAPPISTPMGAPSLAGWNGRILLIAGDRDAFCAVADLEKFHREAGERSTIKIIAGADHFFGGFTDELERTIAEAIRPG
jgi:uncharacterized protein